MKDGYDRQLKIKRELNLEGWRQARFIAYMIARPNLIDKQLSIWNFMPLDGDPTPEEMAEMKQQEQTKQMEQAQRVHEHWKKKKYGNSVKL